MPEMLPDVESKSVESVIGFVVIGGLILCLKRSEDDKSYPGKWCFPGGRIDDGEAPIDALFREVREETGLYKTNDISFVGKYKATLKKRNLVYKISTYQLYYNFPVHLQLSDEHSELRLCTPEEVQELDLAGNVSKGILSEYLKRIGVVNDEPEEE